MTIGRRQRWALYLTSAALWFSGALWWSLARWSTAAPSLAEAWRPRLLALHGLAALVLLVVLGSLLPLHVLRSLRARTNRATGLFLLATAALLALPGWALYYAGDEAWRERASWAHDAVGFALPVLLGLHVVWGRRNQRRRSGEREAR